MAIGTIMHRAGVAVASAALIAFTIAELTAAEATPAGRASAAPDVAIAPVATNASTRTAAAEPAGTGRKPGLVGTLNINTASAGQLVLLPGVGDTKAGRITAWRRRHGRFARIKDLRRVKGFGRKTVQRLRPYLTLTGPSTLRKLD